MYKLFLSHDQNSYLTGADIYHSRCQANFYFFFILYAGDLEVRSSMMSQSYRRI